MNLGEIGNERDDSIVSFCSDLNGDSSVESVTCLIFTFVIKKTCDIRVLCDLRLQNSL